MAFGEMAESNVKYSTEGEDRTYLEAIIAARTEHVVVHVRTVHTKIRYTSYIEKKSRRGNLWHHHASTTQQGCTRLMRRNFFYVSQIFFSLFLSVVKRC